MIKYQLIINKFIIFEDYENSINKILKELNINEVYISQKKEIIKSQVSTINTKNSIEDLNQKNIDKINNNEYFIKIKEILNKHNLYLE